MEKEMVTNMINFVKLALEETGFKVNLKVHVYKDFVADLLAEKDSKKHLIEIETTREDLISSLIYSEKLKVLPEISLIFFAVPEELAQEDIISIMRSSDLGLYKISKEKVEKVVDAHEFSLGDLRSGGSYPSTAFPDQTFQVSVDVHAIGKIFSDIEVSYLPGGPFYVPEGESNSRTINEVIPRKNEKVVLNVGIRKDTEPGTYPLYIKRISGEKLNITDYPIRVEKKNEETIMQIVSNAVTLIDNAITGNIENALNQIDEAFDKGTLRIQENIIDRSIWHEIGAFCLEKGLFRQAELVYQRMLETIRKQEKRQGNRLHKGLALNNLGYISFFSR
jgi:hypothetical protein